MTGRINQNTIADRTISARSSNLVSKLRADENQTAALSGESTDCSFGQLVEDSNLRKVVSLIPSITAELSSDPDENVAEDGAEQCSDASFSADPLLSLIFAAHYRQDTTAIVAEAGDEPGLKTDKIDKDAETSTLSEKKTVNIERHLGKQAGAVETILNDTETIAPDPKEVRSEARSNSMPHGDAEGQKFSEKYAQIAEGDFELSPTRTAEPRQLFVANNAGEVRSPNASEVMMKDASTMRGGVRVTGIELLSAASDGTVTMLRLKLDPVELGPVVARLKMSDGGRLELHLLAARSDTADALKNESKHIADALRQIGLNTESEISVVVAEKPANAANVSSAPFIGATQSFNSNQVVTTNTLPFAGHQMMQNNGRDTGNSERMNRDSSISIVGDHDKTDETEDQQNNRKRRSDSRSLFL